MWLWLINIALNAYYNENDKSILKEVNGVCLMHEALVCKLYQASYMYICQSICLFCTTYRNQNCSNIKLCVFQFLSKLMPNHHSLTFF